MGVPVPPRQPLGAVSDCYAMNIDGEVGWASYYTEFPVVRIDGDAVTSWPNTVPGGGEIPPAPGMTGRGPELSVIIGPDCYRLALA